MINLTRRGVLAALGTVGLTSVAGAGLAGGTRPSFARYTLAQATDGPGSLRVSWYETYNGTPIDSPGNTTDTAVDTLDLETDPAYVADAPGAVVSLGNVLPGDSGTLVVGLQAVDADLNIWFRPVITANAENGQTEPEVVDEGVDTVNDEDSGELGGLTDVEFWFDNSVVFGACDGEIDPLERRLRDADGDIAAGSFLDTADAFASGVRLPFDGAEGCPDALPDGGNRCLGFAWEIPDEVGNVIQSDSLAFALEFAAVSCGDDANPFEVAA